MSSSTAFIPYFGTPNDKDSSSDTSKQQPPPSQAGRPQDTKASIDSESPQITAIEDHRRATVAVDQTKSSPEDQPGWEAPVKLDGMFRRKYSAGECAKCHETSCSESEGTDAICANSSRTEQALRHGRALECPRGQE